MDLEDKKAMIDEYYDNVLLLEAPDYGDALVGVSTDERAVYSLPKMIRWLMAHDKISEDEAMEFIMYNTVRALPYWGDQAPIILEIDFGEEVG